MTRLIALDTETTGTKSKEGDRIIEIGMVEITRDPIPRSFHRYFNPGDREVHPEAVAVHGLTNSFLADKPSFADCFDEILDFIGDSTLVIHNAAFDLEFIRDEALVANMVWPEVPVIDTLKEAARQFPGARHSLDALCNRFRVDTSARAKHGALVDAQILANLYLAWLGQAGLDLTAKVAIVGKESISSLGPLNPIPVALPAEISAPAKSWEQFFGQHPV